MDSREIRERGQFGSQRNLDRTKIKTKRVEKLFDISSTKRVKLGERLKPEAVAEFRDELKRVQGLRNHRQFVYEKDFKDTIDRVNKKIGDKLTPQQERHLRTLFFASESNLNSSGQHSSRLERLHASLEDDSPGKPYEPRSSRDEEEEPETKLGKLRQQTEERKERLGENELPPNLPIAA